ncbi:MAG: zf-HC2 domain-containing protein [Planctomycetes bacterium]|nr:zf-HC2 domain-containing protein [Planctomycetota bacterium]
MNCQEAQNHLWPYLDRELEPAVHRSITRHLDTCDECLRRFRAEETVELALSRTLVRGTPTARIWEGIGRAVTQSDVFAKRARPAPGRKFRWALAAAAALLAIAGYRMFRGGPSESPEGPSRPDILEQLARIQDRAEDGELPLGRTFEGPEADDWSEIAKFAEKERPKLHPRGPIDQVDATRVVATTLAGAPALVVFASDEADPKKKREFLFVIVSAADLEGRFSGIDLLPREKAEFRPADWERIAVRLWIPGNPAEGHLVAAVDMGGIEPARLEKLVEDLCKTQQGGEATPGSASGGAGGGG